MQKYFNWMFSKHPLNKYRKHLVIIWKRSKRQHVQCWLISINSFYFPEYFSDLMTLLRMFVKQRTKQCIQFEQINLLNYQQQQNAQREYRYILKMTLLSFQIKIIYQRQLVNHFYQIDFLFKIVHMKNNDNINHDSLSIEQNIQYSDIVKKAGIVFYNQSEKGKVLEIIGKQVELINSVQIVKSQDCFWILRACGKEAKEEIQEIQRLIGLTFTIICIEISNFLQAIIQKTFSMVLSNAQANNNEIKLIFIKSIYKSKQHSIEIKYCEDSPEAMSLIFQYNFLNTNPIKVFDLIQFFDCSLPENVARVRQVYQIYESLRWKQHDISGINQMIFDGSKQKGLIMQQLSYLNLPSQRENKLIWKLERFNLYKEWLEEEKYCNNIECSKFTFYNLDSKINHISIAKYHKIWTANSFLWLKKSFNAISNKNDAKSIQNFIGQYEAMKQNLTNIEKQIENLPYSFAITKMKEQLEQFFLYHQAIIKDETFGLFKYLKEQMKYLWKYNNRIYKKIAAFTILMAFAYTQGNLIKAVTIISIALIVLALRC